MDVLAEEADAEVAGVAVQAELAATLARRAFSIHDVHPDHGGTVEFIFEADGPGTRWLADRRSRDLLDVVGPLGRPFPLPREPVSCLLLGAGHGSTALLKEWPSRQTGRSLRRHQMTRRCGCGARRRAR